LPLLSNTTPPWLPIPVCAGKFVTTFTATVARAQHGVIAHTTIATPNTQLNFCAIISALRHVASFVKR